MNIEVGMNEFIIADIAKYILLLSNFKKELKISALKKDGIIDREEQRIIDEITAETDRYIKKMQKIVDRKEKTKN